MTLSERLAEHVRACCTGLWIESHEHHDALAEIAMLCREEGWDLATWRVTNGLTIVGQETTEIGSDPLSAIQALRALASTVGAAILVLEGFHRFLQSAEIVQALAEQILAGKQNRTFIVILAPVVQIPIELEKQFVVLEHELPNREQLEAIARGVATEEGELPTGDELARVLDASSGLTRFEAENAYALSLVRHARVTPEVVWSLKAQMLKKSGLLSLHRGQEQFAQLGGLESLKAFCLRSLRQQGNPDPKRRPRGVLLLSPPGCGKSQFAKALGNEIGRPTVTFDIGALFGSLVGETERNVRRALATIDAMSPCVAFIDELEKALGGVGAGSSDSGVSARLFGSVLTWMNDRTSDVYLVGTCNDISKLPPEFARAERWDSVFFIDLPGEQQRRAIWDIYLQVFELDAAQPLPEDQGWSGAEIRACCRLSALLDVPLRAAAQNVAPISQAARESVEGLRSWADGRCLSADRAGIYTCNRQSNGPRRRNVKRDPSNN